MSDKERTVLKLKVPVQIGDETIEELAFRKGRMGDLKGVMVREDSIQWDSIVMIASRLCGHPTVVIEKLDEADAGEVTSIALGFYTRCLQAGSKG
jgi:hypothetical protein